MPYEIYELTHHPNLIKWGILVINALIVWYLAWLLRDSYKHRKRQRTEVEEERMVPP
jgi:uncharacterized membrane protein (DUF2068 family)